VASLVGHRERRFVQLRNAWNLRDLGGYRSTWRGTTRWGQVYRSDTLARLDASEIGVLRARKIGVVIDLRRQSELEQDGQVDLGADVIFRNISVQPAGWPINDQSAGPCTADYLADRYFDMLAQASAAFGDALSTIAGSGETPVVVHCLGGKDRTGVVSALLLWLVGVPDTVIAADYALSELARPHVEHWIRSADERSWANYVALPEPFKAAPQAAMIGFLQRMRAEFGDSARFGRTLGLAPDAVDALTAKLIV
jgi:hypothetical protein